MGRAQEGPSGVAPATIGCWVWRTAGPEAPKVWGPIRPEAAIAAIFLISGLQRATAGYGAAWRAGLGPSASLGALYPSMWGLAMMGGKGLSVVNDELVTTT